MAMNTATYPSGSPAYNAENKCIGAEEAAVKSIVLKRADSVPTGSDEKQQRNGSMETQHPNRNGHIYVKAGFTRTCDYCQRPYTAKRDTSRFCNSKCRVNSHRAGVNQ